MLRPLAFMLVLLPAVALADVTGPAAVIEGDVLEVRGQRIRLLGIDAPEPNQLCFDHGEPWRCGDEAATALRREIGGREVTCEERRRDQRARIVARCTADGVDLAEWMVLRGWAVAHYLYNYEYSRAEHDAKSARRGIWASEFDMPWEWRRKMRSRSDNGGADHELSQRNAADCRIKGNVNAKGDRFYHLPGGQLYDVVKVSPAKGERWFCNEAEARAAGWRKAER